jgi:hypothetical protein
VSSAYASRSEGDGIGGMNGEDKLVIVDSGVCNVE